MPEIPILVLGVIFLTLALGLPLLLKPDSALPDMIGLAILAVLVLAYVWSSGAYWTLLPILAVPAFLAWLDRAGGETGAGDRTLLRFRLWRAANRLQLALIAGVLVLLAAGSGFDTLGLVVPWILVALVATAGLRHSFNRSARRDGCAPAGEAGPVARPE
ncbi:MAG TPA: hypothetical protein VGO55_16800 [Allosphingosinicella sp.]|nr:hypothetical protein [Allosphingosinicella sp.]